MIYDGVFYFFLLLTAWAGVDRRLRRHLLISHVHTKKIPGRCETRALQRLNFMYDRTIVFCALAWGIYVANYAISSFSRKALDCAAAQK